MTPIHLAAAQGHFYALADLLHASWGMLNAKARWGMTALDAAIALRQWTCAAWLSAMGGMLM